MGKEPSISGKGTAVERRRVSVRRTVSFGALWVIIGSSAVEANTPSRVVDHPQPKAADQSSAPIERLEEIRSELFEIRKELDREAASELAQWWGNWPNWQNWANWPNWGNWYNY